MLWDIHEFVSDVTRYPLSLYVYLIWRIFMLSSFLLQNIHICISVLAVAIYPCLVLVVIRYPWISLWCYHISIHWSKLFQNIQALVRVISKYPCFISNIQYLNIRQKCCMSDISMLRYLKLPDIHVYIIFVASYPSFCLLFCHISMFEP